MIREPKKPIWDVESEILKTNETALDRINQFFTDTLPQDPEFMAKIQNEVLKTGTTGVALKYKGGILLAADKRVSAGYVVGKKAEKIHEIYKNVAMSISGMVSDAMSLVDVMKAELTLYEYENGYSPSPAVAASLLGLIMHNMYRRTYGMFGYYVQLIVGGADERGVYLFTIDPSGAVQEDKYYAIGSGSLFSLSIIEDGWKEDMSKEEVKKLATNALKVSISRDLYTGDGINYFFITKEGIERETINFKEIEA